MTERFVETRGTISIANGASVVTGNGTLLGGVDRAGAQLWARPAAALPFLIGVIAEVDPRGVYGHLSIPLESPYRGTTLVDSPFMLLSGPAIAANATLAALYARFNSFIDRGFGLVGDANDYDGELADLLPNTLLIDDVTRTIARWHNGLLENVNVIGAQWTPQGAYSGVVTYALNALVQSGNFLFISNINNNTGNAPNTAPASTVQWTYVPLPSVEQVLNALGIHAITVSTSFPSGGQDGDLWFKVA